jgi:hypothetical protein
MEEQAHEHATRLATRLAEPEVRVEADRVDVGLVDPEVDAADAARPQVDQKPFDELATEASATRPPLEVDVEVRRV